MTKSRAMSLKTSLVVLSVVTSNSKSMKSSACSSMSTLCMPDCCACAMVGLLAQPIYLHPFCNAVHAILIEKNTLKPELEDGVKVETKEEDIDSESIEGTSLVCVTHKICSEFQSYMHSFQWVVLVLTHPKKPSWRQLGKIVTGTMLNCLAIVKDAKDEVVALINTPQAFTCRILNDYVMSMPTDSDEEGEGLGDLEIIEGTIAAVGVIHAKAHKGTDSLYQMCGVCPEWCACKQQWKGNHPSQRHTFLAS
ncbi:hypothetical protein BDN67DRAFT_985732 [Paxillus ammoniavirescens]|nr:hypothetical protein BDN67DRAFT_985732 [Paxillus ammoniavirescens]